jgi:RNA polymerase sigma-70 factor (ECF subfamily)
MNDEGGPALLADETLMSLAAAGEAAAVGHLFERYHRPLYGYFLGWSGNPAEAEDLVQEVFVRVLRYRSTWRAGGVVRPWLWAIARNVCRARPQADQDDLEKASLVEDPAAGPLRNQEGREEYRKLRQAMARLDDAQRELLLLARFAGLDSRALALHFGCTPGAVRVRLHRILTRLRRTTAREPEEERWAAKTTTGR